MAGQYLKKIIAKSPDDLQFISACCYQAKVKISDIKYLPKNKIFIISVERYNRETEEKKNKINSIIKFEFIESTKSKKIDQNDPDLILELLAIDIFKKNLKYEIVLLFSDNKIINLKAECIEISLEDQIEIND
ncbi:MAG: DUF2948 family protein [Pelagibacterales bacterium]|nr:DUF2948 family protein [Pelagibacterales bacterium]